MTIPEARRKTYRSRYDPRSITLPNTPKLQNDMTTRNRRSDRDKKDLGSGAYAFCLASGRVAHPLGFKGAGFPSMRNPLRCYSERGEIILGNVPHSPRIPSPQQKKMRNTRNRSTCLVVT